jgi:hypothetical protein
VPLRQPEFLMARAIFISYRRDDSEGEAGRLYDDLVRVFGDASVFMDVAGIEPGTDFRTAIDSNVGSCGVLLAVIGPIWTKVTNVSGIRRLDDPDDFVRLEIASALARGVPVIPVLVHDAKMPHPAELPDNLKDLAFRNNVELTHARWNSDVTTLIGPLRQYVRSTPVMDQQPVHATIPVQLPPPHLPPDSLPPRKRSKGLVIFGGLAAALIAIAAVVAVSHPTPQTSPDASPQAETSAAPARPAQQQSPAQAPQPTVRDNQDSGVAAIPAINHPAGEAAGPAEGQTSGAFPDPMSNTAGDRATAGSPQLPAEITPMLGHWINPLAGRGALQHLILVSGANGMLLVRAYGNCAPQQCNWGTAVAGLNGAVLVARWHVAPDYASGTPERIANVQAKLVNGQLGVQIDNQFVTGQTNQRMWVFVRSP